MNDKIRTSSFDSAHQLNERKYKSENGDWEWFTNFAGIYQMHNYYVYHIFSTVMNENPQIKRIVELGTAVGGMTVPLGLEAIRKDADMFTFNIKDETSEETKKIFNQLGVQVTIGDIFEDGMRSRIKNLFDRPTYLICDNGLKPDEFNAFVPSLPSGSIVSVHDWMVEFLPKHTEFCQHLIEPFHPELWNNHNVQLATWIRK